MGKAGLWGIDSMISYAYRQKTDDSEKRDRRGIIYVFEDEKEKKWKA